MSAYLCPLSEVPRSLMCSFYFLVSIFFLSACGRVQVNREISPPQQFEELAQMPQQSTQKSGMSTNDLWWQYFKDTQLNQMVEGIFAGNLQLAQAVERVTQMRSLATQSGSQRWPSLNLELGWSRTKQLNPFSRLSSGSAANMMSSGDMGTNTASNAGSGGLPSSFTQDRFSASLAVSYEIDVWGRIGSLTEAADLDALASEADLRAMVITLSASAVDLYFQWIEVNGRLEILENQLQDDEDALQIVTTRFTQGLSPQIEVLQQTQQRDRTRAQIPPVKALISNLKRRLAALKGQHQLTLTTRVDLPELPPFPSIGVPAEILDHRPDIQAAQARLSAADARVSAAVSARLPALRLGVNGGYQSFELNELFDDVIWSVTSGLVAPLFQGGRLSAEQTRTEAVLRERLLALKERYLTAYHEVEDAISTERSASEQLERTLAQKQSAQALFESAQRRYLEGVGDLLTTLTARQSLYASQLASLSAQRSVLTARVQLHRALAGHWIEKLITPASQSNSTLKQSNSPVQSEPKLTGERDDS